MESLTIATELARGMLLVALQIAVPVLAVGFLVGLAIGLLQAVTQVHEQTVSLIPRIFAMAATVLVLLPWILSIMTQYAQEVFGGLGGALE